MCLLLNTISTHIMFIPQPNLADLVSTLVTKYRNSLRYVPNSSFLGKAGVPKGRVHVCDAKLSGRRKVTVLGKSRCVCEEARCSSAFLPALH